MESGELETVTVDAGALREVLQSLAGPQHLVRELQVIDALPGEEGAISKLIRQFNEAVEAHNLKTQNTRGNQDGD